MAESATVTVESGSTIDHVINTANQIGGLPTSSFLALLVGLLLWYIWRDRKDARESDRNWQMIREKEAAADALAASALTRLATEVAEMKVIMSIRGKE